MRPTGRSAWFGVLAILLLQFEFVTHALDEHEHEHPFEVDSYCEVCLKVDKNGNAPLAQMPSHETPFASSAAPSARINPPSVPVRYLLPSRGPPASS